MIRYTGTLAMNKIHHPQQRNEHQAIFRMIIDTENV